ncbi:MAG: hypothetical protein J4G15_13355 [Alphaproteobacteria bacterium]|nr:hypothetical protein [Alphaproteobacteria bacterium]
MTDRHSRRQRALMATDAELERIDRGAQAAGMERSRYIVHKTLMPDTLPVEVLRRAVREVLILSRLEQRRLREAGAGEAWEEAGEAIDDWLEREGVLSRLTDPGAANRWKAVGDDGG